MDAKNSFVIHCDDYGEKMVDSSASPSVNVITSLLKYRHLFSIYSKEIPYAMDARITDITPSNRLILEVKSPGIDIKKYIEGGILNFDIEAVKGTDDIERETYSLSNIFASVISSDSMFCQLECQLPESVFVTESRGAVRIPFILGMQSRARLDIYPHTLSISGRLCDLSVGGCLVEIDLVESIAIEMRMPIPVIALEFPNGDVFTSEAEVRHIRPFGHNGYAAVGIQFIHQDVDKLFSYVKEAEREAAYRTGGGGVMVYPSPLFIPGEKEIRIKQREAHERDKSLRKAPMERGITEVAHKLQIALMYIKNRDLIQIDLLYDCVDTLIYQIRQDRKSALLALSFLRDDPEWVRHAVQTATRLADMLLLRDPHDLNVREAVLGAFIHTLGKPLLTGPDLPSLKITMAPEQKLLLRNHVCVLAGKLETLGWNPGPVCADILMNAHECLDGTGYPAGKCAEELSERVRLFSVIKALNKLMHERNGVPPRTPLSACQRLYRKHMAYDKDIIIEYIQIYGLYPIGCLVKYSGGFIGWVQDIDRRGKPVTVHVVKNLRFPQTNISIVASQIDLAQLGTLDSVVNPADFGLKIQKI